MTKYLKQVKLVIEKKTGALKMRIASSLDSVKALRQIYPPEMLDVHEQCIALFVNNRNETVAWFMVSQGGITSSTVDVRMIFSAALNCLATGLILSHNHPSGGLVPSNDDKKITKQIKEAGELLNIVLIDHIIITEESYFSFLDEGLI